MLVFFTLLESKTVPNVVRFAGFSELKCYNTSWHLYIRLLGSLTLQSETAVEGFIAKVRRHKLPRRKVSSLTGLTSP